MVANGVLRITLEPCKKHGKRCRCYNNSPNGPKLGTRTLDQEVAAALRRETDEQVLRRWAGAQDCHCGDMNKTCTRHHVLAALRWGWHKPVTPVKAMTPSQLKAELTRQYKRLSKGVEDDIE